MKVFVGGGGGVRVAVGRGCEVGLVVFVGRGESVGIRVFVGGTGVLIFLVGVTVRVGVRVTYFRGVRVGTLGTYNTCPT